MNLTTLQPELKQALAIVGRAVAGKSTLPALSQILFTTDEGRLRLTATDLRLGLQVWLSARIEADMTICLPSKLLTDYVGALSEDPIAFTVNDGKISALLECGAIDKQGKHAREATIKGLDSEEFPLLPPHDAAPVACLRSDQLAAALNATVYAAASDDVRPILAGVHILFAGDRVQFSAADGLRAARYSIQQSGEKIAKPLSIVPDAAAMLVLAGILAQTKEPTDVLVRLSPNGNHASFDAESAGGVARVVLIARLIEGEYPDLDRMIPTRYDTRTLVDYSGMKKAVRLASFFAAEGANIMRLTFAPGDDTEPGALTISANAAEVGGNAARVDVMLHGAGGKIALNGAFLEQSLAAIGGGQIAIETQSEQHAAVLIPAGHENELHMIMPMHIR